MENKTASIHKISKQELIKEITDNYRQVEKTIAEQLYMRNSLHGPTTGYAREDIWKELFEMVIPKKFVIEQSVFIIDSKEGVSKEVDFAILDEMYTPYIFRYGRLKFVPIEAIAAVIECKSTSMKPQDIIAWSESIKQLKTSGNSIARFAGSISVNSVPMQKATRPLRILCTLIHSVPKSIENEFDFILQAINKGSEDKKQGGKAHIKISVNSELENLYDWFFSMNFHDLDKDKEQADLKDRTGINVLHERNLNAYKVITQGEENSLLTFNFQLNQLLMLINNPMPFPHMAYVEMFKGKSGKDEENAGKNLDM